MDLRHLARACTGLFALIIGVIAPLSGSRSALGHSPRQAMPLFMSEYVEGSSNNKAIEIHNAGGDAVDLAAANVQVLIYANGSATPTSTISLVGILLPAQSFVIAHSLAVFGATADQLSGSLTFNGDDAVALSAAGFTVDVIGQIGVDPGSEWGLGAASTQDNTLRRLPVVCRGDTIGNDAFDPVLEWTGFVVDTFDGLGSHDAECGPSCGPDIAPQGGNGVVNVDDLLAVINAWGPCGDPGNCPADIAPQGGNDVVNVDDLLAIINAWGPCP